jgi:hypothetical protein
MLAAASKTFRVNAAIVLAALYALCILASSAAFAFSNNPAVARCLTEDHIGVHVQVSTHDQGGKAHVHADGAAHEHHDDGAAPPSSGDDGKAAVAACCGLFSVVAISDGPGLSLALYSPASIIAPALGEALSGRGPNRINRPPIA